MAVPVGDPPPALWRAAWKGVPIPAWRYFREVSSTQDVARAWAEAGAWEGCLVVAEAQTRGRGREGRPWWSKPGGSLTFSVVVRPRSEERAFLGHLAGMAALAVCQVLEEMGLHPRIKWPNDVLLAGAKVAGILIEAPWERGVVPPYVILGIGLNVRGEALPPPEVLDFPATALDLQGLPGVSRPRLLVRIWRALFRWRTWVGREQLWRAWESRLAYRGQEVLVTVGNQTRRARLLGLTFDGRLQVRWLSGETTTLTTVSHLRPVASAVTGSSPRLTGDVQNIF